MLCFVCSENVLYVSTIIFNLHVFIYLIASPASRFPLLCSGQFREIGAVRRSPIYEKQSQMGQDAAPSMQWNMMQQNIWCLSRVEPGNMHRIFCLCTLLKRRCNAHQKTPLADLSDLSKPFTVETSPMLRATVVLLFPVLGTQDRNLFLHGLERFHDLGNIFGFLSL